MNQYAANPWAGMSAVDVNGQGVQLEAGHQYDVKIKRCLLKMSRKAGLLFIAEYEIVNSTSAKHLPGSSASFLQGNFDKYKETALASVKEFIYSVLGFDPRNKDDLARTKVELEPKLENEIMPWVTGPKNGLGERLVHIETWSKETKENKKIITVHTWSPYDGLTTLAPIAPQAPAPGPQMVPPTSPWGTPQGPVSAGLQAQQYAAPAAQRPAAPAPGPWPQAPAGAPPGAPPAYAQPAPAAAPPKPIWDAARGTWVMP